MRISLLVNGERNTIEAEPAWLLVNLLRDQFGLTGTKVGCDTGVCGACTILLDGQAVKSCSILAVQADDREVTTIEGLSAEGMTPVQEGFRAEHAAQCGFCTPGMVVSATALLRHSSHPSEVEIREALEGNLCRCTGYTSIIRAVHYAAALSRGENPVPVAGSAIEVPVAQTAVRKAQVQASDVEVV